MQTLGERSAFRGSEEELTRTIIEVFYAVHRELGFGFLESVYAKAVAIALLEKGLRARTEVQIPVWFHGQAVGIFRADVVVEDKVVLEFKISDQISKVHEAQLLHYLRASTYEIGLIRNFGQTRSCEDWISAIT